jgi:predicted cobalt transporter CbtA
MLTGLAAAAAGLLIAWIYGEPQVGHAIAFEEAAAAGAHGHDHGAEEEVVSRTAQRTTGLITAMAFYGVAIGGLFSIAFAFAYGRIGNGRDGVLGARATAALVALAGFVAIAAAAGSAIVVAAVFRLTPRPDAVADGFPGTVLWDFRIASLGVQVVLWATLGLLFGALTERAVRRQDAFRTGNEADKPLAV